jgi:PIN domain nuclease of toxin-antitoxin system
MPTLLDTHAWVWWVTEDRRLSRPARRAIDKAQAIDALWLSLISVWEVAKKTEKGQLVLDRPLDDWFDLATTRPGLHLAELTRPILAESCRLPPPFDGDPADQIIVATARDRDAVVVTKDRLIRDYVQVRSLW